ncbi:Xyloglucan endotransglucosylase/hydrolase [Forsythia ovata]|uniref:Xyloglucan endotransglucosylase/hydrolase n=1 Tax=Forsythia ovata TaxID=205694 RepID=A0ABD1XDH4_9LAMI
MLRAQTEAKKVDVAAKKVAVVEIREENRVLLTNLSNIADPNLREFIQSEQIRIMQKRSEELAKQSQSTSSPFLVDDIPIRVFKNSKDLGVRFPFNQPMKIYSSLWNADDWATRGGLEKTDWNKAPFVASYQSFHVDGCEASVNARFCDTQGKRWWDQKEFQDLDAYQYRRLRWVRSKYTIYNYCTDRVRYPTVPPECKRDRDI